MRRGCTVSIGLVILALVPCVACEGLWNSGQRRLEAHLKQLEKEEGWRVLVQHLGIYSLDIQTASLSALYVLPGSEHDGRYVDDASFSPDGTKITFGQNLGDERALMVFDLVQRRNDVLLTMPRLAKRSGEQLKCRAKSSTARR